MRKLLLIVSGLMAGLNLSYAQSQDQGMQDALETYLAYENIPLHGNIKKITTATLRYSISSDEKITTNSITNILTWFSKDGKAVKIKPYYGYGWCYERPTKLYYNKKNRLLSKVRGYFLIGAYFQNYYYDTNNRKVKTSWGFNGGSSKYNEVFEYDKDGNIIKWTFYHKNKYEGSEVYVYDNKGNKIEAKEYNAENVLDERLTYRYDANNNEIEQCKYNAKGELIDKFTRTIFYDKEARIKEKHVYNRGGKLEWKTIYSYDAFNNIFKVESHNFKDNGEVEVALSIYDIQYRK